MPSTVANLAVRKLIADRRMVDVAKIDAQIAELSKKRRAQLASTFVKALYKTKVKFCCNRVLK